MTEHIVLRLENLNVRFGDHVALHDVNLGVRRGDCYGFLGHNGAGKTTTMRIALGLERAASGRVIVDGFDAAIHPREARARMGGLIETPGFHGHLGAVANLALLARLQGRDGAAARAEAERVIRAVGLESARTKSVSAYSQGMRQRLGIAQALLGSPSVVILDEPMSGLDPEGIEEIRALLVRLTRDEGTTVLLSSHQLPEIAGLCNRIGILRQGRMLVEEETSVLLAAEAGRYTLATGDDAAAARVLDAAGIASSPSPTGGLLASLGDRRPGDVARALVGAGLDLRAFAPRPPSLEEIYRRFARDDAAGAAAPAAPAVVAAEPAERIAPSAPSLRCASYELRRFASSAVVPLLLVVPAAVALVKVWTVHAKAAADAAAVAAGEVATTSSVTAFGAFGMALVPALWAIAAVLGGIASQSVAEERARGTLRNLLLRPLTRRQALLGKALAVSAAGLAAVALAVGTAAVAATVWFDWTDVTEILLSGRQMALPGGEAEKMRGELVRAVLLVLAPTAAFGAVGFAAGAGAKSGASGLGTAIAACAGVLVAGGAGFAAMERFVETAEVMSNAAVPSMTSLVGVPLGIAAAASVVAVLVFERRSVR